MVALKKFLSLLFSFQKLCENGKEVKSKNKKRIIWYIPTVNEFKLIHIHGGWQRYLMD
jgi:hypothetical protein